MTAQLHGERAQPIELHAIALAQGVGDDRAQRVPHEFHVSRRGSGGVADVVCHLFDVDLLWVGNGYGHTLHVGFRATNEAATGQFAVHHRGIPTVVMHMLRSLYFHRH